MISRSGIFYLLVTGGLFAVLAVIVWRTYRKKNREHLEAPKHRMLDED